MVPQIIRVKAKPDYKLYVEFKGSRKRLFNMKPYLKKGIFKELQNPRYFNKVRIIWGGVEWPHQQDLSAETLYHSGVSISNSKA